MDNHGYVVRSEARTELHGKSEQAHRLRMICAFAIIAIHHFAYVRIIYFSARMQKIQPMLLRKNVWHSENDTEERNSRLLT